MVLRLNHDEVLEALLKLSPSKQMHVFEMWPGISGETPEGLKVTARSAKELRRFTNPRDKDLLAWVRSFSADDVFYDVGANVGGVTLIVAGIHRGAVPIVAIEPSFGSFESLARNLSLNGLLESSIPLQVALLDRTGLQPLHYRSTAAGTSLHAVGKPLNHMGQKFVPVEVQRIPTYRLDDLIDVLRLPAPTVVKIDVDGYEEPVLRGAVRTLEAGTIRELNVEVVDHDGAGTRLRALSGLLESLGYELARTFPHGDGTGYVSDHLFTRIASRRPVGSDGDVERTPSVESPPVARDSSRGTRKAQALVERNAAVEARNAALKEKNASLSLKLQAHTKELDDLRRSYQLSGAAKKVDLRQVEGFSQIAAKVMAEGQSGMHYDRLYALWQAVQSAPQELPFVEIGAYRGGSAKFIADVLRAASRSPRFYVCDTFTGHPRIDPHIDLTSDDQHSFENTSADRVADYLKEHDNVELVVGDIFDTSARLADELFGFVHVDVDLYAATDFCVRFFAPRLGRGALMLIDDYGVLTCPGAQKAVDDFIAETTDFRLFHLLSGQAILFRV